MYLFIYVFIPILFSLYTPQLSPHTYLFMYFFLHFFMPCYPHSSGAMAPQYSTYQSVQNRKLRNKDVTMWELYFIVIF